MTERRRNNISGPLPKTYRFIVTVPYGKETFNIIYIKYELTTVYRYTNMWVWIIHRIHRFRAFS